MDVEVKRDEKESTPHFFFSPCDGCKAVDHAPDLSVFLIKILYLQAQREGEKWWKALSKQSLMKGEEEKGHHRQICVVRHTKIQF